MMRKAIIPLLLAALGVISPAQEKSPDAAAAKSEPQTAQKKPGAAGTSQKEAAKTALPGAAPVDPKAYTIGAEDILLIRVWREPELSGQFMVRPDGKISLPLVNELQAAGLTPEQLSNAIVEGLSRYMNRPEVTVAVYQVNSRKIFIQGEVQKPGAYPLVVPTTVLEALVNAGGFREFANVKKIVILRGTQRFKFNYKDVTHGKHVEQNIQLQPGDQIIVP